METFTYFAKVVLSSGVLFGYYHLALRNRTFHQYNRWYLLASVVLSLLLPLLKISWFTLEPDNRWILLYSKITFSNVKTTSHGSFIFQIAFLAFGLVAAIHLSRFLLGIFKVFKLKKNYPESKLQGISFYETNLPEAPFSFFKNLFWKNSILINSDLGKQILKHEMVHIEQKHSFDKIFLEMATAIFWFNPFFWLIKKEISLVHEYLADKKSVKNMDTKAFAQMLLAGRFSGTAVPGASPFLSSNLKKRLKMLQKPKTKFGYLHRILALPVVFTVAFAYAVNAKNKEIKETNSIVEKAVSQLKQDTIQPNQNLDAQRQKIYQKRLEIEPLKSDLKKQQDELSALGKEFSEKGKLLQNEISKNNSESATSKKLQRELEDLNSKMAKINESATYKNKIAELDRHYADLDQLYASLDKMYASKEFEKNLNAAKSAESYLNSAEYKKLIEESQQSAKKVQAYISSPEYKQTLENAARAAAKASELVNSAEYKKLIEESQQSAKKVQAYLNSPEYKQKLEDATKAAAKASELVNSAEYKKLIEDAKNSAKATTAYVNSSEYKKSVQDAKSSGKYMMITDGKLVKLGGKKNTSWQNVQDYQIYIDGKLANEADWKSLDQKNISSVTINSSDKDGKKSKTLEIETK